MKKPEKTKTIRCAIYTRKSVTEGLEQEFNTLDAQREAAEAYIASQRHEGWVCLPEFYDDGGFTGGNIERPALRQLMADIEAKRVDAVLVYKVDRLSRSLLDFTRIMEVLDRQGVSFVSVTQHFNTTNSMGRLTLNILLSFAQFEREIIAERTRDKMGAARRKGKWVGGRPFLGYDVVPEGRALEVNEAEAQRVRKIFGMYLRNQSLQATAAELNHRGWTMKRWINRKGKESGGGAFNKSSLHRLLTNKSYIGQVDYKGHIAVAEFPGIVEPDVFERVRKCLKDNCRIPDSIHRNRHDALLRGILRCGHCGTHMTHTCSTKRKGNKVYRYYVCNRAMKEGWNKCPSPSLPAAEIERFVLEEIAQIGKDPKLQREVLRQHKKSVDEERMELAASRKALNSQLSRIRKEVNGLISKGETGQISSLQYREDEVAEALAENNAKSAQNENQKLSERDLIESLRSFTPVWESMTIQERTRAMVLLVEAITYDGKSREIAISFRPSGLAALETEVAK